MSLLGKEAHRAIAKQIWKKNNSMYRVIFENILGKKKGYKLWRYLDERKNNK